MIIGRCYLDYLGWHKADHSVGLKDISGINQTNIAPTGLATKFQGVSMGTP